MVSGWQIYLVGVISMQKLTNETDISADMVWMTADGTHAALTGTPPAGFYPDYAQIAYTPSDIVKAHSGKVIASFLDGHVALSSPPGDANTLLLPAFFRVNVVPFTPAQAPVVTNGTFMLPLVSGVQGQVPTGWSGIFTGSGSPPS